MAASVAVASSEVVKENDTSDLEKNVLTLVKQPQATVTDTEVSNSPPVSMINLTISNGEIRPTLSTGSSVTTVADINSEDIMAALQKPIIVTVSGSPGSLQGAKSQLAPITTTSIMVMPQTSGLSSLSQEKLPSSTTASVSTPTSAILSHSTLQTSLSTIPQLNNSVTLPGAIPLVIVPANATNSSIITSNSTNFTPPPVLIVATCSSISSTVATTVTSTGFGSLPPALVPVSTVTTSSDLKTPISSPVTVTPSSVSVTSASVDHSVSLAPPTLTPVSSQPSTVSQSTTTVYPLISTTGTKKSDPSSPDFDPIQAMNWKDGVASLPGSNFKFKLNEFGTLEMISDDMLSVQTADENKSSKNETSNSNSEEPEGKKSTQKFVKIEPKNSGISAGIKSTVIEVVRVAPVEKADDICRCQNCCCYGLVSEFLKSGRFCSQTCFDSYSDKKKDKKSKSIMILKKKKKKQLLDVQVPNPDEPPKKEIKLAIKRDDKVLHIKVSKTAQKFSWTFYLEQEKAIAAPVKLFHDYQGIPSSKNGFKVGMKLEGIDPKHPSMFCVLSVAEVCGFRVRLHFDSYSHCYDFWVNADSPDIFPVGWCEKTGHKLYPPKGFTCQDFNWSHYLQVSKAQAAPKHLFSTRSSQSVIPHGFRVGMKLEAVDKKDTSLLCVASVTDVMDNRFLIHFDGWDDIYDYWADPTSPYIHPVNWCYTMGQPLIPPNNYEEPDDFTWDKYLAETKCQAVPARAFKQRPPHGFKVNMKLEVVDKRNPILIRVATIVDVQPHSLKIHFDGWSEEYDYWVDDDSPDIHPMMWCARTGHPLEAPPGPATSAEQDPSGCRTRGCQGLGHIKGPKFISHHTPFGCPYSQMNMNKESALQDRLGNTRPTVMAEVIKKAGKSNAVESVRVANLPDKQGSQPALNGEDSKDTENSDCSGKMETGKAYKSVITTANHQSKDIKFNEEESISSYETVEDIQQQEMAPEESFFRPSKELSLHWERHSKLLPGVNHITGNMVSKWSMGQVANFVANLPGCEHQYKVFGEEQIDGEAFLLLTQTDIIKLLNVKLGPALKIYNSILMFRRTLNN